MKLSSAIILASIFMSSTSARDTKAPGTKTPKASKASKPSKGPVKKGKSAKSAEPSIVPSDVPSDIPSDVPSDIPSDVPSDQPSSVPSDVPSDVPSVLPSMVPSDVPSMIPSDVPSDIPSDVPSNQPSDIPSASPSDVPSSSPTDSRTLWCFIPRKPRDDAVSIATSLGGELAGNRGDDYEDIFAAKYGASLWTSSRPKSIPPFFWAGGDCLWTAPRCPAFLSDVADGIGSPGRFDFVNTAASTGGAFVEITGKWYTPEDEGISCAVKPENIALAGKATQISTYQDDEENWAAANAINGDKDLQNGKPNIVAITKEVADPWWKLEFEENHQISDILIYNRFPNSKNRIAGFTVSIIHRGIKLWQYTDSGKTPALSMYHIEVPRVRGLRANEIVIQLPSKTEFLQLVEVEVYSYPENGRRPSNTPGTAVASTTVDSEFLEEFELF